MNSIEEALIRCGANIAFKKVTPFSEPSLSSRWIAGLEARARTAKVKLKASKAKQRVIRRVALDPIDRTAALVTSKSPEF